MAPQELDKVRSIESYAEVTKRNGDDNGLDPLKSCHWTVFKRKKNVLSTGHRALEGVSQLKRNWSQNYTGYAPSNSFSKDNEKSQPPPQKKGRPSIIDSGDENWTFTPEVDYFRSDFRSELLVSLSCSNEFSSHGIVLHTKWDVRRFRFHFFLTNRLLEQYTKNLKFKVHLTPKIFFL